MNVPFRMYPWQEKIVKALIRDAIKIRRGGHKMKVTLMTRSGRGYWYCENCGKSQAEIRAKRYQRCKQKNK